MESIITVTQFAQLVRKMRAQQNEYFMHRTKIQLQKAKNLEHKVDQILKIIPAPKEDLSKQYLQSNLFL